MTVDDVREVLAAGGRVRVVVGVKHDDPTCILYLDEGMVISEAVAGWSAGVIEPVCALDSDYLEESLFGWRCPNQCVDPKPAWWPPPAGAGPDASPPCSNCDAPLHRKHSIEVVPATATTWAERGTVAPVGRGPKP